MDELSCLIPVIIALLVPFFLGWLTGAKPWRQKQSSPVPPAGSLSITTGPAGRAGAFPCAACGAKDVHPDRCCPHCGRGPLFRNRLAGRSGRTAAAAIILQQLHHQGFIDVETLRLSWSALAISHCPNCGYDWRPFRGQCQQCQWPLSPVAAGQAGLSRPALEAVLQDLTGRSLLTGETAGKIQQALQKSQEYEIRSRESSPARPGPAIPAGSLAPAAPLSIHQPAGTEEPAKRPAGLPVPPPATPPPVPSASSRPVAISKDMATASFTPPPVPAVETGPGRIPASPPLAAPAPAPPSATTPIAPPLSIQPAGSPFTPPAVRPASPLPAKPEPRPVVPPPSSIPPPRPSRPFGKVMQAFMEEKNIRWGEMIGGLIVTGCSIALVISLWSTIEAIPLLKFGIFVGVAAAIFGLGLYSGHHWKLPATSRSLLTVAILLVPLDFLAVGAFSQGHSGNPLLLLGMELGALALFGWLTFLAARWLFPASGNNLAAGVTAITAGQFLIRLFPAGNYSALGLLGLAALPAACLLFFPLWNLARSRADGSGRPDAHQLWNQLSLLYFPALLTLGFLVYRSGEADLACRRLSPVICLLGLPALLTGLSIWRRLRDGSLAATRTAGAVIALLGAAFMLAGFSLAWPEPAQLIPAGLAIFIMCTAAAVKFSFPVLHYYAAAGLIPSLSLLFLVLTGQAGWLETSPGLVRALASARHGQGLTAIALLLAAAAYFLQRRQRETEAGQYRRLVLAAALPGLILSIANGFAREGDPHGLVWLLLLYAAGSWFQAFRQPRPVWVYAGLACFLGAWIQALVFRFQPSQPWLLSFLAAGSLWAGAAALLRVAGHPRGQVFLVPFIRAAGTAACATIILVCQPGDWFPAGERALLLFWLAALLLLLARLQKKPAVWFAGCQLAATAGLLFLTRHALDQQPWHVLLNEPFSDARTWQGYGIALAILSVAWTVLRLALNRLYPAMTVPAGQDTLPAGVSSRTGRPGFGVELREWLHPPYMTVDRLAALFPPLLLQILALAAVWPGISAELSFAAPAMPLAMPSAAGPGSWILLGLLLAGCLLSLWKLPSRQAFIELLFISYTPCFLLAARLQSGWGTATGLRWLGLVFILLWSLPLWRGRFRQGPAGAVRLFLGVWTVPPLLVISALPLLNALCEYRCLTFPGPGWYSSVLYAVPLLAGSLICLGYLRYERRAGMMAAAGWFLMMALATGYVLLESPVTLLSWIRLLQLAAALSALYALFWLTGRRRRLALPPGPAPPVEQLLRRNAGQFVFLSLALYGGIAIPAISRMILLPWLAGHSESPSPAWTADTALSAPGGLGGWLSVLAAAAVWLCWRRKGLPFSPAHWFTLPALAGWHLAAVAAPHWSNIWTIYPFLQTVLLAAGILTAAAGRLISRRTDSRAQHWSNSGQPDSPASATPESLSAVSANIKAAFSRWAMAGGAGASMLAVLGAFGDPARPLSAPAAVLTAALLAIYLACWQGRRFYLRPAGLFVLVSVNLWWMNSRWADYTRPAGWLTLLEINLASLALTGLLCLWLEFSWFRRRRTEELTTGSPLLHLTVFRLVFTGICLASSIRFVLHFSPETAFPAPFTGWLALGLAFLFTAACRRNRELFPVPAALYFTGLFLLLHLHRQLFPVPDRLFGWSLMYLAAGYALFCTALIRKRIRWWPDRSGNGGSSGEEVLAGQRSWLVPGNLFLTAVSLVLAVWCVLTFPEAGFRLGAAAVLLPLSALLFMLAEGPAAARFRQAGGWIFLTAPVLAGWSLQNPESPALFPGRIFIALSIILTAWIMTAWPGRGSRPVPSAWRPERQSFSRPLGWLTLSLTGALIFYEQLHWLDPVRLPLGWWMVPLFLSILTGLSLIFTGAALFRRFDPLRAGPGRSRYSLLLADIMLGLTGFHLFFTISGRPVIPWLLIHCFLYGFTGLTILMLAFCRRLERRGAAPDGMTAPDPVWLENNGRRYANRFLHYVAVAGLLMAMTVFSGAWQDPHRPWGPFLVLLVNGFTLAAAGIWARRRDALYPAALGWLAACNLGWNLWQGWPSSPAGLACLQNALLALAGLAALLLDLGFLRRRESADAGFRKTSVPSFQQFSLWLAVFLSLSINLFQAVRVPGEQSTDPHGGLALAALLLTALLLAGCRWDPEIRPLPLTIYLFNFAPLLRVLALAGLPPGRTVWLFQLLLAFHSLLAACCWRLSRVAGHLSAWLRLPARPGPAPVPSWLAGSLNALAVAVAGLAVWPVFTWPEDWMRSAAAGALLVQALALGLLVREKGAPQARAAMLAATAGIIATGWAWISPESPTAGFDRMAVLLSMLVALVLFPGIWLVKRLPASSPWMAAARQLLPWLAWLSALVLASLPGMEIVTGFQQGSVSMSWLAILSIGLALAGAVVAGLLFAALPGRDPLNLPLPRRQIYVYAAELMLGFLFLHVRLTMPWLFRGFMEQYWPLILMALAYLGAGLSEYFRRRRHPVLAIPLSHSSLFFSLLPVAGFWILPSRTNFSGVILLTGLLFGILSALRRSFLFGLVAVVAANGGLWSFLRHTENLGFLQHPQLWLAPLGLTVLLAAQLNRRELSPGQMALVRYLCLSCIYLSSTADIMLRGVAASPWLPLVLMAFSVAGVLAGLLARISSFLLLGTVFLILSLLAIIRYADVSLGWTWLWYVMGIFLGLGIIFLFAIFEKRRQDLQRVVENLREWEK